MIDKFVSNDDFVLGTDAAEKAVKEESAAESAEKEVSEPATTPETDDKERRDTDGSTGGVSE